MANVYKDYVLGPAMAASRLLTVNPSLARPIMEAWRAADRAPHFVPKVIVDSIFLDTDEFLETVWDEARVRGRARLNPLDRRKKRTS